MPTSSINKNLVLETEDECKTLLGALEQSELNTPINNQPSTIKELSTQQQCELIKSLIK